MWTFFTMFWVRWKALVLDKRCIHQPFADKCWYKTNPHFCAPKLLFNYQNSRNLFFQMARLYLQARLARSDFVPVCLLHPESYLPTRSQPRPEKDLRGDGKILRRALESDSLVLRPGFLRLNCDDALVEPIHRELASASLRQITDRNFYRAFLGPTPLPCSCLQQSTDKTSG